MLKRSRYSKQYNTLKQAQQWAYKQDFKDIWYLIYDREEEKYQLVNDSRLDYLQNCWGLDMRIIETWR